MLYLSGVIQLKLNRPISGPHRALGIRSPDNDCNGAGSSGMQQALFKRFRLPRAPLPPVRPPGQPRRHPSQPIVPPGDTRYSHAAGPRCLGGVGTV